MIIKGNQWTLNFIKLMTLIVVLFLFTFINSNKPENIKIYSRSFNKIDLLKLYLDTTDFISSGYYGQNQQIGIVDTEIPKHPDLENRLINLNVTSNKNDNLINEYNYQTPNHGTIIALLIGSSDIGIAPESQIVSVKAIDNTYHTEGLTKSFAEATKLTINNGIEIIINANTWGEEFLFYGVGVGDTYFDPHNVIKPINNSDAVIIFAAGNHKADITKQIAYLINKKSNYGDISKNEELLEHVVYVGSYNSNNHTISNYSNFPGKDEKLQNRFILIPELNLKSYSNEYINLSNIEGTSYSAGIFGGAIALILSQDETLNTMQAINILLKTATYPCSNLNPKCNTNYMGQGVLNLPAAFELVEMRKTHWSYFFKKSFNYFNE